MDPNNILFLLFLNSCSCHVATGHCFNDNEVVSKAVKVDIVTDLIKTLPGNGSVTTFKHAAVQGGTVLPMWSASNSDTTLSSV
jgi:hypothetical protein